MAGFATLDLFLVPNVNKYPFAGSKPTLLQEKKPNPQSSAIQNQVYFYRVAFCPPQQFSATQEHVHHKHLSHIVKSSLVQGQQLNTLSWFYLFQDTMTT